MLQAESFTPRELHAIHELLAQDITAVQKIQSVMPKVDNPQFKSHLYASLQAKKARISQIGQLIGGNPAAPPAVPPAVQ